MERVRQLWSDAQAYLAAASPRERRLLGFAAGGVSVFLLLVVWGTFASAIGHARRSLDDKRGDFEKIAKLASGYGQREQERQLLEARLRQSPPALMGFVDGIARQAGVDVGGMQDRGVVAGGAGGKPRETSVEVSLSKVPLEKLVHLLQEIDRTPGVIRVRRLRLRKSSDAKDVLDVSLSISTWQAS